ncbi:MAG: hypothetical protein LIO46_02340 [Clostridiales bacterium]|nr:hypothetical protein [Clostridiales bacterium]
MIIESYLNAMIGTPFKQASTFPSSYFLGISKTPISEDGTGITEPGADTGYSRYEIPIDSANWTTAKDGKVKNVKQIIMDEILVDSGTAYYWFLSPSATGDAVIYDELENERPLPKHSTIYINPEELVIGVENPAK